MMKKQFGLKGYFRVAAPAIFIVTGLLAFAGAVFTYAQEGGANKMRSVHVATKGAYAFVLNADDSISIYDVKKGEYLIKNRTLSGEFDTNSIWSSKDGSYFAVLFSSQGGDLIVWIYNTQEFVKGVEVPFEAYTVSGRPIDALFTGDDEYLYLGTSARKAIWKLGLANRSEKEIPLEGTPTALAFDEGRKKIYAVQQYPNKLNVINQDPSLRKLRHAL
jgi:WD40 repeat protein